MKNMIKVLWYIIVSAMVLAMFVMVTSKVFAHGDGKCITDPSGNVFLSDDSWVKIDGHLKGKKLDIKGDGKPPYLHGHQQQYYDVNDNPTAPSTSFWDIDFDDPNSPYYGVFDDFYVDCPTAPQPTPQQTPQPQQQNRPITQRVRESGASEEVIEEVIEEVTEPQREPRDPTCDADFSVAGIICYNYQIEDRYQLIGFPVLPIQGIDDIGWLHYFFEWKLERHNLLFQVFVDEHWRSFTGGGANEANPEVGDIPITPHLAIMVNFKRSEESIGLLGTPQDGEIIDLEPGIHLIGLPEAPGNFNRASDFLSVDGVEWVKIGYSPSKHIDSQDDPDDQDLKAGQAIRISVTKDVTLDLGGSVAAAPSVRRRGTLATSWGAMKR